jgi:hypothetical protein
MFDEPAQYLLVVKESPTLSTVSNCSADRLANTELTHDYKKIN